MAKMKLTCPNCHGSGTMARTETADANKWLNVFPVLCDQCSGSGVWEKEVKPDEPQTKVPSCAWGSTVKITDASDVAASQTLAEFSNQLFKDFYHEQLKGLPFLALPAQINYVSSPLSWPMSDFPPLRFTSEQKDEIRKRLRSDTSPHRRG